MSGNIHPTAIISKGAELADDVTVGPFAIIEEDTFIGKGTRVDSHASVKKFTRMGENNHIHSYSSIGGEPQDLKFRGEESWLEIGNNNNIREFATLSRGTEGGGGLTKIGDNNLLMAYTHVAHDCVVGSGVVMSNGATLAGHVELQDGAILGGLSAVHQFTRVGRYSFLGAMSGITQDLPPYMLSIGNRDGGIHGPNIVGLRRLTASQGLITALKQAFRIIWQSELPRLEALEQVEKEYSHVKEIMELADFIRSSERGIMPACKP